MIRTKTREGIALPIVIEGYMSHFGMDQTMEQTPIDHRATAYTGANGQVDEGIEPLCGPPFTF